MQATSPRPPCTVCGNPSQSRPLCKMHYNRFLRTGSTERRTSSSGGLGKSHPLWEKWQSTKGGGRVAGWDFLPTFIADVGSIPSAGARLHRIRTDEPWGPTNFRWHEHLVVDGRLCDARSPEYQKAWREKNPRNHKNHCLKRSYGLTIEDYERMLAEQGGVCAICREECTEQFYAVDHCHETGKVRGLLCRYCNHGLGNYRDNPTRLRAAAEYLERQSWAIATATSPGVRGAAVLAVVLTAA